MGFFDDSSRPEARRRVERLRRPDWVGPPENVAGTTVAIDRVLVNTGELAIVLANPVAYPTGVTFTVRVLRRAEPEYDDADETFLGSFHNQREGRFRVGVQLADGRKAVAGEGWDERPGDGPLLVERGGGGGGLTYAHEFWLWPLPPPGPLVVACEWPAEGVGETMAEIDTEPIRAAAARAVELWPDERPVGDEW